jgi:Flp pilus assembly protein TadG
MSRKRIAGFLRESDGAAAVEFALVATAFTSFLFGTFYIGVMMFTDVAVHWATEKAARLATLNTNVSQSAVSTAVNGYLSNLGIPSATVAYSVGGGAFPVAHITTTLSQTYDVPLISRFNITYSAEVYVPQGF